MRNKVSIGEYIACLSVKYEVEPDKLFGALVSARDNHKSTCGDLSITCRSVLQDKTVLLITNGSKVVAQFPVSKQFFSERSNSTEIIRRTDMLRLHQRQRKAAGSIHVGDLRTGMKRVSLKARVLEIAKPALVFTKYGSYAKVANAILADETGTVKLCLWNEQINSIHVGDTVQVENANVSMFKGERQLRIGKHGTLRRAENVVLIGRNT